MTAPALVAISPELWEHPDDAEAGYVRAEDVQRCEHCRGHGEVRVSPMGAAPWGVCTLVECGQCDGTGHVHADTLRPLVPATCSQCDAPIDPRSTVPLCQTHDWPVRRSA